MELIGDIQLMHKFKTLPQKIQNKHGRRAISKAARLLVNAAKAKCPVNTGLLRKSLGFRPKTYKTGVYAIVGPRVEDKNYEKRTGKTAKYRVVVNGKAHNPSKIAHLVEGGHGGPHAAPAHPFLKPAMDQTASSNITLIADEIRKGMAEEAI